MSFTVLDEIISKADEMQNVRLRGLMVMPPYTEQNEKSRKYFALLEEISTCFASALSSPKTRFSFDGD